MIFQIEYIIFAQIHLKITERCASYQCMKSFIIYSNVQKRIYYLYMDPKQST